MSTPIGAADDLTLRGLDALRRAEMLACEDTRVLRKLMSRHGVDLRGRPLVPYHDRNGPTARPKILAALTEGRSVLYASDAGTPLIADPGWRLASEARALGAAIHALPGPSAVLAALVVSGLPTDKFCFGGFAPPRQAARRAALEAWTTSPGTLVFYEAPRRLADCLADMRDVFGDRPAAIARELTKTFEEVRRGRLAELAEALALEETPKGEIVILIGPADAPPETTTEVLDAALRDALAAQSSKDAVRQVAENLSAPRKMVYERMLIVKHTMNNEGEGDE